MDVINATPVVCDVQVSTVEGTDRRYVLVTAKATFTVDARGRTALDGQAPYPLFSEDQPTPLGLFPSDAVPRRDRMLEVVVLGSVHGHGKPRQTVELAVGERRRSLLVTGDRHWISHEGGPRISEPAPFDTLPLSWARAYGGTVECWLDKHSLFDLEHGMNRYGRGFDAEKMAADVGQAFKAPPGYPRLPPGYRRPLPNIEDPQRPIRQWTDEPRPVCWSPIPTDIGAHLQRAHDHMAEHKEGLSEEEMIEMVYHRAHPDWILPVPAAEAAVSLKGMTKRGAWRFHLPSLRVLADYEVGDETGTHELAPQLLMLLPDESRIYLVYRHFSTMKIARDVQRSLRVRLEKGWKQ
jgi:hypothetical protein